MGGSVCSRRAKNAIGLKPTIAGQLLGDSSGHILGSFRSYFIHNGLGRAEILQSEQIFGKSFVHRGRDSEQGRSLLGKSAGGLRNPLSFLPQLLKLKTKMLACCIICPLVHFCDSLLAIFKDNTAALVKYIMDL